MPEDVLDLLGCLRRSLGEMLTDALGPFLDRHGVRQMVEGVLPDEPDEVFGRVELRGVGRGVEEIHGDALGQGDLRQQLRQRGLHGAVVDGAVVEDEQDVAETQGGVAQDDQGDHADGVFGFPLGLEIDGGLAAVQVQGQEAVQLLPPLLVARRRRGGVLLRPGVMGAGRGQQGELVQGYEGGAGTGLGGFFSSALTKSARSAGLAGP
jgi:hypothetical protein